jgi:hypothetical protein
MGKYSEFTGKIGAETPGDNWAKITAAKRELLEKGITTIELAAARYQTISVDLDVLEEDAATLRLYRQAVEQILLDLFERDRIKNVTTDFGLFSRVDIPQVKMDNKQEFYAWLKSQGMDDLFTVNANTANMIVKEALLAGKDLPPGTSISMRTNIRMKGKKHD